MNKELVQRLAAIRSAGASVIKDLSRLISPIVEAAVNAHNRSAAAHPRYGSYEMCLPWLGTGDRDKAGTGSVTVPGTGLYVQVKTGTTAGSRSAACAGAGSQPILTPGTGSTVIDADAIARFRFPVSTDAAASDGVARLVFGRRDTDTTGDLTFAGWALEIRYRRLWLVAWDGELRQVDLGVDLVGSDVVLVTIERTVTGFDTWVDGVKCPSLVCGNIGQLQNYSTHRAETENRTSSAEHRFNFGVIHFETI